MEAAIRARWCARLQSGVEVAQDSCRLGCPETLEAFCKQNQSWLRLAVLSTPEAALRMQTGMLSGVLEVCS